MSRDSRAAALRALSQYLVAERPLGDTLLRVSQVCLEAMPSAEMAGIAMLDGNGRPTTGVYTNLESPEIDSGQYQSGKGPCLDAWRDHRVVRIDDMDDAAATYPEFAQKALAHGVHSTLSLPMVAGGNGVGALNLYARVRQGFTEDDEVIGVELAAVAATLLANAAAYWGASQLSDQLGEAMKSRAVIEQAKGILMAQSPSLDADGAFDVLRQASQRENVKLREIAQRIVERRAMAERDGH